MDCLLGSGYETGDRTLFRGGIMAALLKNLHKPTKIFSLDMFWQYCHWELPWHMADRTLWLLWAFYSESSLYESGILERLHWLPSRVALFRPSIKLLIKDLKIFQGIFLQVFFQIVINFYLTVNFICSCSSRLPTFEIKKHWIIEWLTLRLLMSYIYICIWNTYSWCF